MTFLDKYEKVKQLIKQKIEEFIQSQTDLLQVFYEIGYNGELKEFMVLKVDYYNSNQPLHFNGKKPNRDDMRRIESVYYNLELDKKYFCFIYDQHGNWKTLERIESDQRLFLDKAMAEVKAKEIADRIALEEQLLANGHERCQRCRKVVPKEQIVTSTIIGRDRKPVYNSWKNRYESKAAVTQTPMKFCSGTCAGHEQMSREG